MSASTVPPGTQSAVGIVRSGWASKTSMAARTGGARLLAAACTISSEGDVCEQAVARPEYEARPGRVLDPRPAVGPAVGAGVTAGRRADQ